MEVKERPILFNGEMVKAILDGRKTQTRRVVKLPLKDPLFGCEIAGCEITGLLKDGYSIAPLGTIGDRLWVREMWGLMAYHDTTDWCRDSIKGLSEEDCRERYLVEHSANWNLPHESAFWRPSIHMPRWASRITLEITGVRVERLQEISEEDVWKEGWEAVASIPDSKGGLCKFANWGEYWNSIYTNWDANPWVWVYEFRRIKL